MTAVTFPYPAYTYRWTSGYGNRVNALDADGQDRITMVLARQAERMAAQQA